MIKKTIWILVAVTVLAFVLGTTVRADEWNKKSAARGDSSIDRHIAQISDTQAFVYSKSRPSQLAKASNAVVPAIAIDITSLSLADLQTVPIVAVTPDEKHAATAAVIQARALPNVAARVSAMGTAGVFQPVQKASHATHLPQTASALPLIVLLSVVSIGVAFGLMMFGRRRRASSA